jgi:cytochrome c553
MRIMGVAWYQVVAAFLAVPLLFLAVLGIRVNLQLAKKYTVPDVAFDVPADSATIARGEHLSLVFSCRGCHGNDLEGTTIFETPLAGRIHAPNLTPGGVTKDYTVADWDRAVRHGVKRDGRGIMIMSSEQFWPLSDADLAAIIAYARSVPRMGNASPPSSLRPLGWVIATVMPGGAIAAARIDHAAPRPAAPPIGVTPEYGDDLANACRDCHGKNLSGGSSGDPSAPPAPNLTPSPDGHLANWTQEQFMQTIRGGMTPEYRQLSSYMPWTTYAQMTDDELAALWLYLHGLPPRASTAPKRK